MIFLQFIVILFSILALPILLLAFKVNSYSKSAPKYDSPDKFEFILVFGAKVLHSRPSNELKSRLDLCLKIWKQEFHSVVILAGGTDATSNEPQIMYSYLLENGIPEKNLKILESSFNTRETIRSLSRLTTQKQKMNVLAISSSYHSLRISLEAKKKRLNLEVASDTNSPESRKRNVFFIRLITEVCAIIFYQLPHKITKRVPTATMSFRHRIPNALIRLTS